MQNKITLLLAFFFTITLTAQQRTVSDDVKTIERTFSDSRKKAGMATDTVFPPVSSSCDLSQYFLYSADTSGYVIGTNAYGDLEKAQLFLNPQPSSGGINGLVVYFGAKKTVGSPDFIYTKIYTESSSGEPGTLLDVSDSISIANIDTSGVATFFSFDETVAYTNSFFASIVVDVGDDTVGIESTEDGCGLGHAYEKWNNDEWHEVADVWSGLEVSIEVYAVIDDEYVGLNERMLSGKGLEIYPNPASDHVQLQFDEAPKEDISLRIKSIDNNSVGEKVLKRQEGKKTYSLKVNDLRTGAYLLEVHRKESIIRKIFVKE